MHQYETTKQMDEKKKPRYLLCVNKNDERKTTISFVSSYDQI